MEPPFISTGNPLAVLQRGVMYRTDKVLVEKVKLYGRRTDRRNSGFMGGVVLSTLASNYAGFS
jgi:hypothetical protein